MLLIEGIHFIWHIPIESLPCFIFMCPSLLSTALYLSSSILVFENADNGGGMDPEKMRQCMSLGYSAKSKLANTIGQCNYSLWTRLFLISKCLQEVAWFIFLLIDGNGFKTSTMRLGADVIVFSRCPGKDGKRLVVYLPILEVCFWALFLIILVGLYIHQSPPKIVTNS